MNRFLLSGLLLEAFRRPSSRIGYVSRPLEASEALALCDDEVRTDFEVKQVYRINGSERIVLHNGSEIRFFRTIAATRGASFDVLLIDRDVAERTDHTELRAALALAATEATFL